MRKPFEIELEETREVRDTTGLKETGQSGLVDQWRVSMYDSGDSAVDRRIRKSVQCVWNRYGVRL